MFVSFTLFGIWDDCRATINEGVFFVDTVLDSRYLEMDVVREREGSLNGSEVEGGAKKL